MRRVGLVLAAAVGSVLTTISACQAAPEGPAGQATAAPSLSTAKGPEFKEVAIHDPAILWSGDSYYVFGSHLGCAKSKDLMSWEYVGGGVRQGTPLFADFREELKETLDWAQTRTFWAPDVVRLKDGRYAMYYCACKGDSPRSALGLAIADKPEGPYKNQGILLKSGMWGQPSEDGKVYDPRIHPNAVDPTTFFDAKGSLWMVYGSYSGGIFIMKMDPKTGKTLPGQGYGKKLIGGNHSRIEGPYILYSPESKYYYLYLSFGGLDSRGGYNVRVARSRQPDGPYVDAAGKAMINCQADAAKPLFDDRSIEPFGTKLMGGFEFAFGEKKFGYLSPGHNSAYYDPSTKRQFLAFHTRFPGTGERFEMRVHRVLLNKAGWPVVAPLRYSNLDSEKVTPSEVSGSYQALDHGQAITAEPSKSQAITLAAGGSVTGARTGSWKLTGNRLALKLDGMDFDGFAMSQWEPESGRQTITLTALSKSGAAFWAVKFPEDL